MVAGWFDPIASSDQKGSPMTSRPSVFSLRAARLAALRNGGISALSSRLSRSFGAWWDAATRSSPRPPFKRKPLLESLEPRVLLSADSVVPRIEGTLDTPGETDRYGFTLNDRASIVFDSLTNSGNINWKLEGPRGAVSGEQAFNASDSVDRSGNVVYELTAGDYTLTVDGVGDTTGAYAFRLLDIAQADEITPGTEVSGTLDTANETDAYRFSVVAGQRFYFDRSASTNTWWRLVDPYGRTVWGPSDMVNDVGDMALGLDGSYTLLIEGRVTTLAGSTSSYRFNVIPQADVQDTLAVGDVVTGRIEAIGERRLYSFTLDASSRLMFDALANRSAVTWSLSGASGTLVSARRFDQSDANAIDGNTVLALAAGDYTLTIDGVGDAVTDYAFRLLDLADAETLVPGTPLEGSIGDLGLGAQALRPHPGAPLVDATDANGALGIVGSTRFLSVDDAAALNPQQLTLEAWIRTDGTLPSWATAMMKSSTGSWNDGYGLANFTDGRIHFFLNNYSSNNISAALVANTWTHVAATYDGAEMRLYVNGELAASKAFTGAITHSAQPLRIGNGSGGYPWRGQIDEARVWSVARSAAEIAANYQQALAGNEAGLEGWWRMDEPVDAGSVFVDSSAAGRNALLVNAPAVETRLFAFDAVAGQRYFLDQQALSSDILTIRLFDPRGNLVAGPRSFTDIDVFTAAHTGKYVLAVEGRIGNGNGASFTVNVQPVSDSTRPTGTGVTTTGTIAHPGQRHFLEFSLASDTRLYFDSLTSNANLNWTLVGPRGTEVAGRTFTTSDSAELTGRAVLDLVAGDYTITVDSAGDATGDYAFRLLDLSAATTIVLDADTTGRIDPGSTTDVYRIQAEAGDTFLLDRINLSSGSPSWRLIDPTGALVFGPEAFADRNVGPLYLTGAYTLLFEGRVSQQAAIDYGFRVTRTGNTPIAELTGTSITLGANVSGTIGAAGEVDTFVFDLAAPTRLFFDGLAPNGNGNFRWALVGPRGTEMADRAIYYSESSEFTGNPVLDLVVPGTYQVRIWANGSTTGAYGFRMLDLAAATAFAPGTPVSGTLNPVNETDAYRFEATAGTRYFFDRTLYSPANSDWVTWRLVDPFGRQVIAPTNFYYDIEPVTLAWDGEYTLFIEGRIWTTQYSIPPFSYGFTVRPVVDDPAVALVIGADTAGAISSVGQVDTYTFELDADRTLYFDSLTNNSSFVWSLAGPDGIVASRNFTASDSADFGSSNPLLSLRAGSYTVRVDSSTDVIGGYAFRLRDLRAEAVEISLGATVSGAITPSRITDVYKFEGTAGERYYFDRISYGADYYSTTYRLIDPSGNQIGSGYTWSDDRDVATFALSGTYLVLVEGRVTNGDTPNDYSFRVLSVQDTPVPISIGEDVTASITQPGRMGVHTFSLGEATRLVFDAMAPVNNSPQVFWSLRGPRGYEVSGRQFYYSEAQDLGSTSPVLDLIAGDYTLTFDVPNDQVGTYRFRLLDIADAVEIMPGASVAGQLTPPNATTMYRFEAEEGVRYALDRQALTAGFGSDWMAWTVIDPFGRKVVGPANFDDQGVFTPAYVGTYTILVEGRLWDRQYFGGSTVDYTFRVVPVADETIAIVPGEAHGTATQRVESPLGNGLLLDGMRYIEIADSPEVDLTGSVTFETMFRVDNYPAEWQALVYKGNGNYWQRTYTLWVNSAGYVHLSTGDNSEQSISTAAGSVLTGQWTHVAAVLDRTLGVMKLYLNGVEAASGALRTSAAIASDNPIYLGRSLEGHPLFQGAIDEFRLWNGVRTPEQIADLANASLVGAGSGAVVNLTIDETDGNVLVDDTGNGHDGLVRHQWDGGTAIVAGRIDPGQRDNYTFTLDAAARLYFDSLINNSELRWDLVGPRGLVVSNRPMTQGDSYDGFGVLELPAGAYTLTMYGANGANGLYGFRLLDLGAAPMIDYDALTTGRLDPGTSTAAYRFEAEAGDTVYLDRVLFSGSNDTYWRLVDPFGRNYSGPHHFGNDIDRTTLPYAGFWTVLVEGRYNATTPTNFSFRVARVEDTAVAIVPGVPSGMDPAWTTEGPFGSALRMNGMRTLQVADADAIDLASGAVTFETWVKVDAYRNTWTPLVYKGADANASLRDYSLWLNANGSVYLSSADQHGEQGVQTAAGLVNAGDWHHVAGVVDRATGKLRIVIDGVDRATADIRVLPARVSTDPLHIGTDREQYSDHANLDGSLAEFRFWNRARTTAEIAADMDRRLDDTEAAQTVFTLRMDEGDGTVLADASGNGHAGAFGELVNGVVAGDIAMPGQQADYTFTLTARTRLVFDALTNNSNIVWRLRGPGGVSIIGDRSFTSSDSYDGSSVLDLAAGDYTLTVDGLVDATGPFEFRLLPLDAVAEPLPLNTRVDAELSPSASTAVYGFHGDAGQRIYLDAIARTAGDIYWRLVDPDGRVVFGPSVMNSSTNDAELTLAKTGDYTLLIEGRYYIGGNTRFGFAVHTVVDQTAALTLDTDVTGTLAMPGQRDRHTFTLANDGVVYFDAMTNDSRMRWSLTGPRGTVIDGRSFTASDSYDLGGSPVLALVAGDYTLTIDGDGDDAGAYAFRLHDLSTATGITLGANVEGRLARQRDPHLQLPRGRVRPPALRHGEREQRLRCRGACSIRGRVWSSDRATSATSAATRCRPRARTGCWWKGATTRRRPSTTSSWSSGATCRIRTASRPRTSIRGHAVRPDESSVVPRPQVLDGSRQRLPPPRVRDQRRHAERRRLLDRGGGALRHRLDRLRLPCRRRRPGRRLRDGTARRGDVGLGRRCAGGRGRGELRRGLRARLRHLQQRRTQQQPPVGPQQRIAPRQFHGARVRSRQQRLQSRAGPAAGDRRRCAAHGDPDARRERRRRRRHADRRLLHRRTPAAHEPRRVRRAHRRLGREPRHRQRRVRVDARHAARAAGDERRQHRHRHDRSVRRGRSLRAHARRRDAARLRHADEQLLLPLESHGSAGHRRRRPLFRQQRFVRRLLGPRPAGRRVRPVGVRHDRHVFHARPRRRTGHRIRDRRCRHRHARSGELDAALPVHRHGGREAVLRQHLAVGRRHVLAPARSVRPDRLDPGVHEHRRPRRRARPRRRIHADDRGAVLPLRRHVELRVQRAAHRRRRRRNARDRRDRRRDDCAEGRDRPLHVHARRDDARLLRQPHDERRLGQLVPPLGAHRPGRRDRVRPAVPPERFVRRPEPDDARPRRIHADGEHRRRNHGRLPLQVARRRRTARGRHRHGRERHPRSVQRDARLRLRRDGRPALLLLGDIEPVATSTGACSTRPVASSSARAISTTTSTSRRSGSAAATRCSSRAATTPPARPASASTCRAPRTSS